MTTYHKEHLLDRAAMVLMRTMLAVQPKLQFVPETRPDFDELDGKDTRSGGCDVRSGGNWWGNGMVV